MTTVQIIGIGIAATILVVLVISLAITRRKDKQIEAAGHRPPAPPVTEQTGSFLDAAPRDEFEMLGVRETVATSSQTRGPIETAVDLPAPTSEPGGLEPPPQSAPELSPEPPVEPVSADEPPQSQHRQPEETAEGKAELDDSAPASSVGPGEATPLRRAAELASRAANAERRGTAPDEPPGTPPEATGAYASEPVVAPVGQPAIDAEPRRDAAQASTHRESGLVPLSDIIVTTNDQLVDLNDPDVRRMLKDLVKDEIDLAGQYREQGQNVDAVLQLTEAERICNALGMTSHARLISEMIKELQA